MNTEQKKDFLINAVFLIFIVAVGYLMFKYLLPILVPFIIGYCVAFAVVKLSAKIKVKDSDKFKVPVRILITVLFFGIVGTLIVFAVMKGFSALYDVAMNLPEIYEKKINPAVGIVYDWIMNIMDGFEPGVRETIESGIDIIFSSLSDIFGKVSSFVVSAVVGAVKSVPSLFLSMLAMIISTFFFVIDYEKIMWFARTYIPKRWQDRGYVLKSYVTNTLFVVIRSYLLIMLLTFSELTIMFTLFGIPNAMVIATVIAIFDIMPILGTGGIMIPWAIISVITGNPVLGIKLIIIYGIVTVIRNYVEPKIVGAQLGIHPLITLVSMFIGLRLFGFLGMFGIPVGISFFWKRYKEDMAKKEVSTEQEMSEC